MSQSIHYRSRLEGDPTNILFRFSLGQALFEENNFKEAADHLARCVERRPDWMVAEILLGKALLADGDREASQHHLRHALKLAREQNHEGPEEELTHLLGEIQHGGQSASAG